MSELTIKINGSSYTGWTQGRVMRSLESIADSFDLTLTDQWGSGNLSARDIKTDMPCEIWIDDQPVITGYIDEATPSYDAKNHTVSVRGRSKAGDLVDSSLPSKPFHGQDLLAIAKVQCEPFGIDVRSTVDVSKPFTDMAREDGQTIFEFLEQAARIRAVRLVSEPDGNLLITRAGTDRISTRLELGENILSASGQFSSRDRFTHYVIHGQTAGDNFSFAGAVAHLIGRADDDRWTDKDRYRPTVIDAEVKDKDDCDRRAWWQRNTAYGRSHGIVYTVRGWRHAKGLWQPNFLVPVSDRWMGIDEDLLIVSTQFLLDKQGERAEIQVMPKEAFDLVELPEPASKELSW